MKYIREVDFVTLRTTTKLRAVPDAYMLRKDRPAQWLQRACLFILRKLGATAQTETTEVRRVRLDGEKFIARLFQQKEELFHQFGYEPCKLLIGGEDYEELMGTPEVYQLMRFAAPFRTWNRVADLDVIVVPWMRGMVVIPDKWA